MAEAGTAAVEADSTVAVEAVDFTAAVVAVSTAEDFPVEAIAAEVLAEEATEAADFREEAIAEDRSAATAVAVFRADADPTAACVADPRWDLVIVRGAPKVAVFATPLPDGIPSSEARTPAVWAGDPDKPAWADASLTPA